MKRTTRKRIKTIGLILLVEFCTFVAFGIPLKASKTPPEATTHAEPIVLQPELKKAVEKPLESLEPVPVSVPDYVRAVLRARGRESDFGYVDYIFSHESTWNPGAVNSIGCLGLGQSCGHSSYTCGLNVTCQAQWFDSYAQSAYGGWANAYYFWVNNHWW